MPTAFIIDFVHPIFSLNGYFQIMKFKTWLKKNPRICWRFFSQCCGNGDPTKKEE